MPPEMQIYINHYYNNLFFDQFRFDCIVFTQISRQLFQLKPNF